VLGGCAAIERQEAADTEKLLAAAGVPEHLADSAERQQDPRQYAPSRFVAHSEGAKDCVHLRGCAELPLPLCRWPKEYAEYRRLAVSEAIAAI